MHLCLCTRVFFTIYAYMWAIYAYIEPCNSIYGPHIYMFTMLICLFACIADAVYVQIYANECKFMLHCVLEFLISLPHTTIQTVQKVLGVLQISVVCMKTTCANYIDWN